MSNATKAATADAARAAEALEEAAARRRQLETDARAAGERFEAARRELATAERWATVAALEEAAAVTRANDARDHAARLRASRENFRRSIKAARLEEDAGENPE